MRASAFAIAHMPAPTPAQPATFATTLATLADADALAPLFDAYRVFYLQPPNLALAREFIRARLRGDESTLFLCRDADSGEALGFTQLYPSFTSISARRLWILNDLFVAAQARRRGVARALMERARRFAAHTGALRLVLETADDNHAAQALYESLGYVREAHAQHYALALE
jgi:ribosomal protein S18 acetylase RimI-like enzyme